MAFSAGTATNKARALMTKALTGSTPIIFTRIAVGDGKLTTQVIASLEGLLHEVVSVPINSYRRSNNTTWIYGYLSNAGVTQDFYYREIGLFAEDPDVGEILYCYAYVYGEPETIPKEGESPITRKLSIGAYVGNAETVTVVMDDQVQYALADLSNVTTEDLITAIELSGVLNRKADLGGDGKVLDSQMPDMNYDAMGSAEAVQKGLNVHLANKNNPHGVTLAQLGAAAASHTHDIADLISGILSVARGGTGASTLTANYPIFGNGTSPAQAKAPLTAMALLGDGYGTCNTAADNIAKVVTLANFVRRTGSRVTVYFKNAVPKSSTMNVGGTGAALMRYRGTNAAEIIRAGTYADFVFDGTYWQLLGISTAPVNIVNGSYTGTGIYGKTNGKINWTTITVGFRPWIIVVMSKQSFSIIITPKQDGAVYVLQSGVLKYHDIWEYTLNDGIQFYNTTSAIGQLNESGTVYEYVAIG